MNKSGATFDLSQFLPQDIATWKSRTSLGFKIHEDHITLNYITHEGNNATKTYSAIIPRHLSKNKETLLVLGLLQAEMGKTQNGCLSFANSEPRIINKVIAWFQREFELEKDIWKWSIKVNLNEPRNNSYKKGIEQKCVQYWLKESKLDIKITPPEI